MNNEAVKCNFSREMLNLLISGSLKSSFCNFIFPCITNKGLLSMGKLKVNKEGRWWYGEITRREVCFLSRFCVYVMNIRLKKTYSKITVLHSILFWILELFLEGVLRLPDSFWGDLSCEDFFEESTALPSTATSWFVCLFESRRISLIGNLSQSTLSFSEE